MEQLLDFVGLVLIGITVTLFIALVFSLHGVLV